MASRISQLLIACSFLCVSACTSFWQIGQPYEMRDGVSSSLVDYLYPRGEAPPDQALTTPHLDLPLRVGIAFVPPRQVSVSAITEATKNELLENVSRTFIERDYIAHIEVIPDTYLRSSSGFDGMQQVARLYGVDVMALVSYDQVASSEDKKSSFLYWTIVGAYLIKGTENEVQTFVDTAVFDVSTRKLLFRAPGTDQLQVSSTAIESVETVRKGRGMSFAAAMDDMTRNLSLELDDFERRLEEHPTVAQVTWSGGGGSISPAMFVALFISAACGWRRRDGWSRR